MPPSRHSGSSRSAHKDSDQIQNDQNYALGDYSFRIERTSVPGSTNDKIEAICTKDGKNARKSIQVPSSTKLSGWYVEANETEASVYAVVEVQTGGSEYSSDLDTSPVSQPISTGTIEVQRVYGSGDVNVQRITMTVEDGSGICYGTIGGGNFKYLVASKTQNAIVTTITQTNDNPPQTSTSGVNQAYTYKGKTVYYILGNNAFTTARNTSLSPLVSGDFWSNRTHSGEIAWTMVYGTQSGGEYTYKEVMIGRFAIELKDAGGVGPGSDWTDPGDYDEDWEPEEPTHTLYVEVTGALSGRHNDPIVDPSYSYIPADKDTVKDYGCGGDGGHGGGGGAGASTVVIHKFATNQANSKEVTAIARRHGYGSGGGKGGKGGDGCILVYY